MFPCSLFVSADSMMLAFGYGVGLCEASLKRAACLYIAFIVVSLIRFRKRPDISAVALSGEQASSIWFYRMSLD